MTFSDLGLAEPILRSLISEGYTIPTPIQAKAIPVVMEGKDILGCAQTGTGKTAAFALPILHRLANSKQAAAPASTDASAAHHAAQGAHHAAPGAHHTGAHHNGVRLPRVLVLSPTRELASQIAESFKVYGRNLNLRYAVIFGGMNQNPQVASLRSGVDVIIATPGRLEDLMNQRHVNLSAIEMLVLDEADQMLDMGFITPIRRISSQTPKSRQTLMFSATMPPEIRKLADTILRHPTTVAVAAAGTTADNIEHTMYHVDRQNKPQLLTHLLTNGPFTRALVFTRTKHGADRVTRSLQKAGIKAGVIHGNKTQGARRKAIADFKSDKCPVLVATDVAARGLDIDAVSHVINYDVPNVPETYVHRIGRTARAGASGCAISFCDSEEKSWIRAIERLTKKQLKVLTDHPAYVAAPKEPMDRDRAAAHQQKQRQMQAQHPEHQRQHRQGPPQSHKTHRSAQPQRANHNRAAAPHPMHPARHHASGPASHQPRPQNRHAQRGHR